MSNQTSKSIIYSLWLDTTQKTTALQAVKSLFDQFHETFQPNLDDKSTYTPYLQLGQNYFLIAIEQHWSPGDICGMMKWNKWIGEEDSAMATLISSEYYIPDHGLSDKMKQQVDVKAWESESRKLEYLRVESNI